LQKRVCPKCRRSWFSAAAEQKFWICPKCGSKIPKPKEETKWEPAIDFSKCYLSVYPTKETCVFLSREAFHLLLGRPKRLVVSIEGNVITLSPARKHGEEVKFSSGQPYIIHPKLGHLIGAGGKAQYDYDEERGCHRYFYFRLVKKSKPNVPSNTPRAPKA